MSKVIYQIETIDGKKVFFGSVVDSDRFFFDNKEKIKSYKRTDKKFYKGKYETLYEEVLYEAKDKKGEKKAS